MFACVSSFGGPAENYIVVAFVSREDPDKSVDSSAMVASSDQSKTREVTFCSLAARASVAFEGKKMSRFRPTHLLGPIA